LQQGRRKKPKPAEPASTNIPTAVRNCSGKPTNWPLPTDGSAKWATRQGFFSRIEFRSVLANLPAYLLDFGLI